MKAHRESPNPKGEYVRDAGDGDRHSGVFHGLPDPLGQGQRGLVLVLHQVVPAGHDHEHVVDTNTWKLGIISVVTQRISDTRTNCNKREDIMSLIVFESK